MNDFCVFSTNKFTRNPDGDPANGMVVFVKQGDCLPQYGFQKSYHGISFKNNGILQSFSNTLKCTRSFLFLFEEQIDQETSRIDHEGKAGNDARRVHGILAFICNNS